ncbi:hypothetical protein TNCV_4500192 [Trichonephila clavipes]|nr:hypothetical protein TNCV_4500192 [Trichonephila clavipes]
MSDTNEFNSLHTIETVKGQASFLPLACGFVCVRFTVPSPHPIDSVKTASQYGGYDPRLVTEWERIPNKAWLHLLQGKEVGLSPVMDFRPEWKAAHPVCYMLVSSFVRNVYILLFVLYVSVLPLVFHMYTRIKTDDNNNNNESLLNKRSMHVKFKVRMPNGSGDLVISE